MTFIFFIFVCLFLAVLFTSLSGTVDNTNHVASSCKKQTKLFWTKWHCLFGLLCHNEETIGDSQTCEVGLGSHPVSLLLPSLSIIYLYLSHSPPHSLCLCPLPTAVVSGFLNGSQDALWLCGGNMGICVCFYVCLCVCVLEREREREGWGDAVILTHERFSISSSALGSCCKGTYTNTQTHTQTQSDWGNSHIMYIRSFNLIIFKLHLSGSHLFSGVDRADVSTAFSVPCCCCCMSCSYRVCCLWLKESAVREQQ